MYHLYSLVLLALDGNEDEVQALVGAPEGT